MRICCKCECIFPDYHGNCPSCGNSESREWKQAPVKKGENEFVKKEEILEIISYEYDDLKDLMGEAESGD